MVTPRESLSSQLETGNRGEALERACHHRSWELSGAMKLFVFWGATVAIVEGQASSAD